MNNYFRITAYNPIHDISFIIDSNGKFDSLGDFSAFLIKKNCKIIQIGRTENFQDGNIFKIEYCNNLVMRACMFGKPERKNAIIAVNNRYYKQ